MMREIIRELNIVVSLAFMALAIWYVQDVPKQQACLLWAILLRLIVVAEDGNK